MYKEFLDNNFSLIICIFVMIHRVMSLFIKETQRVELCPIKQNYGILPILIGVQNSVPLPPFFFIQLETSEVALKVSLVDCPFARLVH